MNRLELITSKEWYEAELECRLFELGFKPKKAEKLAKKLVNKSFMRGINELAGKIKIMDCIIQELRCGIDKQLNPPSNEPTTGYNVEVVGDWVVEPEYVIDAEKIKEAKESMAKFITQRSEEIRESLEKALEERKKRAEKFMNNFKEGGITFKNKHIKEVQNDRN